MTEAFPNFSDAVSTPKRQLCADVKLSPEWVANPNYSAQWNNSIEPETIQFKCNECRRYYKNFKCAVKHMVKKHNKQIPATTDKRFIKDMKFPYSMIKHLCDEGQQFPSLPANEVVEIANKTVVDKSLSGSSLLDALADEMKQLREQLELKDTFLKNANKKIAAQEARYDKLLMSWATAKKLVHESKLKFKSNLLPYHKNIECCPICCDEDVELKTTQCCGNQICAGCHTHIKENPVSYRGAECPFCKSK